MTLPRLAVATQEVRALARLLRGTLRLRVETVPLVEPVRAGGQHLLDMDVPGAGIVTVLGEPAGPERPDGQPLRLSPVTRVQMAQLFALLERLDVPSETVPPPEEPALAEPAEPDDADTLFDPAPAVPPSAPPSSHAKREAQISSVRSAAPEARPASSDPRVGRLLAGKYLVEAPLGSGAAATVYRATHTDLRRPVAVKILHAQNQSDPQFVKRFKAEALTASRLEHVNVTRVLDFGQEDGILYLVMELVSGRTLDAVLAAEGPLDQRRVAEIGIQTCRALAFAHDRAVIHRDIKPENLMIVADHDDDGDPCDLVKVCDFGLAKLRDEGAEEITLGGMLCGSPAYMSPEQTRGAELDARSDLYALGVTLFEALTGAPPHDASSLQELFLRKATEPPRRPSSIVQGIDPLLEDVLLRAMATDPGKRHASARELRTELRAVAEQLAVPEPEHKTIVGG